MKNNMELRGTLNAVLVQLDADKHDADEWECIAKALAEAQAYADKCARMRRLLANRAAGAK